MRDEKAEVRSAMQSLRETGSMDKFRQLFGLGENDAAKLMLSGEQGPDKQTGLPEAQAATLSPNHCPLCHGVCSCDNSGERPDRERYNEDRHER